MTSKNPWLAESIVDETDVSVFNRFAKTLSRLDLVDFMFMEIEQQEFLAPGCGCGGCYYDDLWVGVMVKIGEVYEEYEVINDAS